MKNVASFMKTRFYLKGSCSKIGKHAEMFHASKGCKIAIIVFISISPFSKKKSRVQFAQKRGLAHSLYSILSDFITSS